MSIENVENMISFNLFNPAKLSNTRDLNLKEYNEYSTKFLKLSNLSINTIDDLAEKVTTPIYYLFSCVKRPFFCKEIVETSLKKISVNPDFYDYDEINFFTKIYFYDEPKNRKELPVLGRRKMEVKLNFRFGDLFHKETPIFIIRKSIEEELEKSTDLINFNKDIIMLKIGYTINHPISKSNKVIAGFE